MTNTCTAQSEAENQGEGGALKVSEAIEILRAIQSQVGDLEIVSLDRGEDSVMVEFRRTFDVVELPNDDGTSTVVCAFIEATNDEGDPTGETIRVVFDLH